MYDKDANEAKRIYNEYGKYFIEIEEHNINRKILSKTLFSMMGNVKDKKILDAGCGCGKDCKALAEKGACAVGIDVSQRMIEISRNNCDDIGNQKTEFHVEDMGKTGFRDGEFDIVLAAFSLPYKKDLRKVIREFKRILKENGELYIIVPHPIRKMVKYTKNYFRGGKYWEDLGKMKVFNYHRTMEEYINTLASERFFINEIRETKPIKTSDNYFPMYLVIKSSIKCF